MDIGLAGSRANRELAGTDAFDSHRRLACAHRIATCPRSVPEKVHFAAGHLANLTPERARGRHRGSLRPNTPAMASGRTPLDRRVTTHRYRASALSQLKKGPTRYGNR